MEKFEEDMNCLNQKWSFNGLSGNTYLSRNLFRSFYEETIWYDGDKSIGISQTHVAQCVWSSIGNVRNSRGESTRFFANHPFSFDIKHVT